MPRFRFEKLVRDKLIADFVRLGQVAKHRTLKGATHSIALQNKIIEEAQELPLAGSAEDIAAELADIQQAVDDLKVLHGITDEQVATVQLAKYEKKGGFLSGAYVETLEVGEDDPWLGYYRDHPSTFVEIGVPLKGKLQPGIYRHYKGKRYQVVGTGQDTETEADVVIYMPLYESDVVFWVRPLAMFSETVIVDGISVPRFEKVD
jgi:predicted house-cleaning noncanonical NTP pyrophosphatase (MazG superfamily)